MSDSAQLPLFSSSEEARRIRKLLLAATREVVEYVGPKVVAPEINLSPSGLLDAVEERERHGLSFRAWCEILARDSHGQILESLCEALGYEPPVRRPVLSPEQERDILVAEIQRCGPVGEGLLGRARARGVKV